LTEDNPPDVLRKRGKAMSEAAIQNYKDLAKSNAQLSRILNSYHEMLVSGEWMEVLADTESEHTILWLSTCFEFAIAEIDKQAEHWEEQVVWEKSRQDVVSELEDDPHAEDFIPGYPTEMDYMNANEADDYRHEGEDL
jgi:hypothetical protein